MHDLMFANQTSLTRDSLVNLAAQAGLDVGRFQADLDSHVFRESVERHISQGRDAGVTGTPNFFFNGVVVKGSVSWAEVEPILLARLAAGKALVESGSQDPYAELIKNGKTFVPFADNPVFIDVSLAPTIGGEGARPTSHRSISPQLNAGSPPLRRGEGGVVEQKGDREVKGSEAAEIELVLFCDFQCPYCRSARETVYKLLDHLGERGRLVFKQFPLGTHPQAHLAAQAALAALAQGKFWEMHDKLFTGGKEITRKTLEEYARDIGLDVKRFCKELDEGRWVAAVDKDIAEGRKVGVRGTPTLFVNGRMYRRGLSDLNQVAKDIDRFFLAE